MTLGTGAIQAHAEVIANPSAAQSHRMRSVVTVSALVHLNAVHLVCARACELTDLVLKPGAICQLDLRDSIAPGDSIVAELDLQPNRPLHRP